MGRPTGYRMTQASKILIGLKVRLALAKTRTVLCPYCSKPVDRWKLTRATSVARIPMTDDEQLELAAMAKRYGNLPTTQRTDAVNDLLSLLDRIDFIDVPPPPPWPGPSHPPVPPRPRPVSTARFKIRKGTATSPTIPPERATPLPSPDRRYALYRVRETNGKAIRVGEFDPTDSMAQALLAKQGYFEDGDMSVQVHWFKDWAPASVEYPAYLTHIVTET